jgi:hypothetical protein
MVQPGRQFRREAWQTSPGLCCSVGTHSMCAILNHLEAAYKRHRDWFKSPDSHSITVSPAAR